MNGAHEDSYPFLSGATLRAAADVIFERQANSFLGLATVNSWKAIPSNR
jgi:hypothetical protein